MAWKSYRALLISQSQTHRLSCQLNTLGTRFLCHLKFRCRRTFSDKLNSFRCSLTKAVFHTFETSVFSSFLFQLNQEVVDKAFSSWCFTDSEGPHVDDGTLKQNRKARVAKRTRRRQCTWPFLKRNAVFCFQALNFNECRRVGLAGFSLLTSLKVQLSS